MSIVLAILACDRSQEVEPERPLVSGLNERPANPTCVVPLHDAVPELLSDTGCVNPANPLAPAPGTLRYDVIHPFWADGAEKDRWLSIPDGETIVVDDDGDWLLPVGASVVKVFRLGDIPVETRWMVHRADGWAGYTYRWSGDDAVLVGELGETLEVAGQLWTIPSREQCVECHTLGAGSTLGLDDVQLNRSFRYEETGRDANQVFTFDHIGLFGEPRPAPDELPALAGTDESKPVEARVRSYLHANCAGCHTRAHAGVLDMRWWVPLDQTGLCDVSNHGAMGLYVIVAGDPSASALSAHMHERGSDDAMPPIGTNLVDPEGTTLIDGWIASMEDCP